MAKAKSRTVPVGKAMVAQQAALMRLQLYLTGATHQVLREFYGQITVALANAAGSDGKLDGMGLYKLNRAVEREWPQAFGKWRKLFELMRQEAVSIPVGSLAVYHEHYLVGAGLGESQGGIATGRESTGPRDDIKGATLTEARKTISDGVFEPQLQAILDAANRRLYGDGMRLSDRIWSLDQTSLDYIKRVLSQGVADGRSAWDMAKDLERALGAGAECPRWTRERLNGLTKADIASGDRTGLLSGDACDESGVAYNALRLARNEIQVAHHMATDALMANQPWIEKEQINLSPAHAEDDECDDVANGGERGEGIYPKGEISLPLHVQCLCFKTAVLMGENEFIDNLRGWMRDERAWPEMDAYAQTVGWDGQNSPGPITGVRVGALVSWLWDEMDDLMDRIDDL